MDDETPASGIIPAQEAIPIAVPPDRAEPAADTAVNSPDPAEGTTLVGSGPEKLPHEVNIMTQQGSIKRIAEPAEASEAREEPATRPPDSVENPSLSPVDSDKSLPPIDDAGSPKPSGNGEFAVAVEPGTAPAANEKALQLVAEPGSTQGQPERLDNTPDTAPLSVPKLAPLWRYLPVPPEAEVPDQYPEYHGRLLQGAHGLRLVAARTRGKKHKHEGTNCDDWFEIAACGEWNLIAVADGAGSKQFSRVGAKTACQVAITKLKISLGEVRLSRLPWTDTNQVFARDAMYDFIQADVRIVADALRLAIREAVQNVEGAVAVRRGSERHQDVLGGRDIQLHDLAATLLLIAQTCVADPEGRVYDLAMSIAIGDGAIGAISKEGQVYLMMDADHGQFSGETEFLNERMLDPLQLNSRLRPFIGRPQRAFLVMTDGVADDYFPNNPGLARLFGDLILNGIVDHTPPSPSDRESVAAQPIPPVEAFTETGERLLDADKRQSLSLYSAARYAEHRGATVEQLLTETSWLRAGCRPDPLPGVDAAERLLSWLDAYQIRGSFDDRTLVVAYRERMS